MTSWNFIHETPLGLTLSRLSRSSVHNEKQATEGTISLKASLIFVFSSSLLVFMSFGAENRKRRHNLSCQVDAV
jgi:hypothetical protein